LLSGSSALLLLFSILLRSGPISFISVTSEDTSPLSQHRVHAYHPPQANVTVELKPDSTKDGGRILVRLPLYLPPHVRLLPALQRPLGTIARTSISLLTMGRYPPLIANSNTLSSSSSPSSSPPVFQSYSISLAADLGENNRLRIANWHTRPLCVGVNNDVPPRCPRLRQTRHRPRRLYENIARKKEFVIAPV
jgi:hypothetical protein